MIPGENDALCALSKASISNLVVTMDRIGQLSRRLAAAACRDSPKVAQSSADIMLVADAAAQGVEILDYCFTRAPNHFLRDGSDERQELIQRLRAVLSGISNGARLVSLLEFDTDQDKGWRNHELARQNLALHSALLGKLFAGLICYELAEGGQQNCTRKNCMVRKMTTVAERKTLSHKDIQWVC